MLQLWDPDEGCTSSGKGCTNVRKPSHSKPPPPGLYVRVLVAASSSVSYPCVCVCVCVCVCGRVCVGLRVVPCGGVESV